MSRSLKEILTPELLNQAFSKTLQEVTIPYGNLVRITDEYYTKALDFFNDSLIADEVLCVAFGVRANDTMNEMAMEFMKQNMSLMLVDPQADEVMAIRVMGVGNAEESVDLEKITDQPMKNMLTMWEYCDVRADFFKHYNITSAISFFGLAVARKYRQKGFATNLMEAALEYIKNFQVSPIYIKTAASSLYSAKVFEKLEFEVLDEFKYEDYQGEGNKSLGNLGEHLSFKSYGKVM